MLNLLFLQIILFFYYYHDFYPITRSWWWYYGIKLYLLRSLLYFYIYDISIHFNIIIKDELIDKTGHAPNTIIYSQLLQLLHASYTSRDWQKLTLNICNLKAIGKFRIQSCKKLYQDVLSWIITYILTYVLYRRILTI